MDKKKNNPVVHLHNGILCSSKKEGMVPFATAWMKLETIRVSEIIQSVKDKYHMISHIVGSNEQND